MFSNFIGKKSKKKKTRARVHIPLVSNQDADPAMVEAFRTLLSNMRFCNPGKTLKSLLVTSTASQEGKSTIVANLGILLAQGGSRVLLVDADLRKPALCDIFKLPNTPGLTDLLMQVSTTQINKGNLQDFSVGDAFQLLKIQKKSGIFSLEKEEIKVSLFFKDGEVIEAHYNKNVSPVKGLREIFTIKDGTFKFQETSALNDPDDLMSNHESEETLQKTIPQIYRQPFIENRTAAFLKPTHVENLTLLTSGITPPNPTQLLGSESMNVVANLFRNRFDAIIFDTPPSGVISDAYALTPFVDAVILVVRKGFYDKKFIMKTKENLERVTPNICGVIFNQADLKHDVYYYAAYGYDDSR